MGALLLLTFSMKESSPHRPLLQGSTLHFLNEGVDDGGSTLHFLNEGVDDGGSTLHFLNEGVDDGGSTHHFLKVGVDDGGSALHFLNERVDDGGSTLHFLNEGFIVHSSMEKVKSRASIILSFKENPEISVSLYVSLYLCVSLSVRLRNGQWALFYSSLSQ